VQVASALIGGADLIQSSGYDAVFELEAEVTGEHGERGKRMSRNTSHILSLESMLGMVEDAAFGSYHLENLSQEYASEAWKLMQELISKDKSQRAATLSQLVSGTREQRELQIKTRKQLMAGTNDYANPKETLPVKKLRPSFYRTARSFEELRLQMEQMEKKPQVEIKLAGDYAALSPRINFVKNYFNLLGLEVHDPLHPPKEKSEIIVLCAADADYPELMSKTQKSDFNFVAGKVELSGFTPIFAGQNVYEVLKNLVEAWGAKS